MRRYMMTLVALFAWMGMSAMDYETARERAYYLTDKMAYELNLNDQQYNDAYEINLDYLLSLNNEADLADARYLTYRNDDLRHILYDWQWTAFAAVDYLFRPVWWLNGGWYFPVFRHYTHGYYFYHRPSIFWDYRGGHGRIHFAGGFYHNRRPMWHGGLRGMHQHMIGHPNGPRGGRYGQPGGGPGHDSRGSGYRFDHNGRGGQGGLRPEGNRPGNEMNHGQGHRPDGNRGDRNPGGNHGNMGGGNTSHGHDNMGGGNTSHGRDNMGSGNYHSRSISGSSSRSSMGGSRSGMGNNRSSMGGNHGSMGSSRGGGFSGSRGGASFGGGSRGGSRGGGASGRGGRR